MECAGLATWIKRDHELGKNSPGVDKLYRRIGIMGNYVKSKPAVRRIELQENHSL